MGLEMGMGIRMEMAMAMPPDIQSIVEMLRARRRFCRRRPL